MTFEVRWRARWIKCGSINFNTGNIRSTVRCSSARTVARRWSRAAGFCRSCRIRGWRYRVRECGYECGKIVARRGRQSVVFYTGA